MKGSPRLPAEPLRSDYELTMERVNGRTVMRARSRHAETGLKITLTFPAENGASDLERVKARLARLLLAKSGFRQGPA